MPSIQSRLFITFLKNKKSKLVWNLNTSISKFREDCEKTVKLLGKLPKEVTVKPFKIGDIYAEWIMPPDAVDNKVLLYCIGGGYISGSCNDHRALVARIARQSGVKVLLFEHRLAPEHPFPAALNDSVAAYNWLMDNNIKSSDIVIIGESAGGGLCLATLLALRDRGISLPVAAVAISPWTDLKLTGNSLKTNAKICLSPPGMNAVCCSHYVGENDPAFPLISPLYGDLQGLPPLLIQVGGHETLLDDSLRFAEKAREAGVNISLTIGEGMMHCYPLLPDFIPEARRAMEELSSFIRFHLF